MFDLLVIAILVAPLFVFLVQANSVETIYRFTWTHEDWQVDEPFALGFCWGLIAMVFSWRRLIDLRREMARRKEAESEAHQLARNDVLTGLPNRRRFLE